MSDSAAFINSLDSLYAELVDKGWTLVAFYPNADKCSKASMDDNFVRSKGYRVVASKGSRVFCYRSNWSVQSTEDVAIFDAVKKTLTRYKR